MSVTKIIAAVLICGRLAVAQSQPPSDDVLATSVPYNSPLTVPPSMGSLGFSRDIGGERQKFSFGVAVQAVEAPSRKLGLTTPYETLRFNQDWSAQFGARSKFTPTLENEVHVQSSGGRYSSDGGWTADTGLNGSWDRIDARTAQFSLGNTLRWAVNPNLHLRLDTQMNQSARISAPAAENVQVLMPVRPPFGAKDAMQNASLSVEQNLRKGWKVDASLDVGRAGFAFTTFGPDAIQKAGLSFWKDLRVRVYLPPSLNSHAVGIAGYAEYVMPQSSGTFIAGPADLRTIAPHTRGRLLGNVALKLPRATDISFRVSPNRSLVDGFGGYSVNAGFTKRVVKSTSRRPCELLFEAQVTDMFKNTRVPEYEVALSSPAGRGLTAGVVLHW